MATSDMEFECMTCGKLFANLWFDLGRSYDRVHYMQPPGLPEVEVTSGEGIGVFCSRPCLDAGRRQFMQDQGVPIPQVRPGIGPVEQCAKCAGPVDMNDWHLTFSEALLEERTGEGFATLEFEYLAVVCRTCSPLKSSAAESAIKAGVSAA